MNPHGRVAFLPFVLIKLKCQKPKGYSENPKTIGEHVRKRRMELGLTLREAGRLMGVTEYTVINWEGGHCEPSVKSSRAIRSFLYYDPLPEPDTLGVDRTT